jgi:glycosyltransferase involved in cell wall biosynthesis
MKVNILDPALSQRTGHHFDYDRRLLRHYAAAGHELHVYVGTGSQPDLIEDFDAHGSITELFKPFRHTPAIPFDRDAAALLSFHREVERQVEELRSAEPADLWIWPSMRAQDLMAFALSGIDAPTVGCIHQDPGIEAKSTGAMLWRLAVVTADARKTRFKLGSVEPELRHRFAPIMGQHQSMVWPHPYDGPPIAEPKRALERIGFFGNQRGEKGIALVAPLARQLLADGYAVTFHVSNIDYEKPVLDGVDWLGFVDDLSVPIAECDLVVLPYEVERYSGRGSGILAQCLALGIPVTAPTGTLPGRTIEHHQMGPLFPFATLNAVYAAIRHAKLNYTAYAENAFRTAQGYAKSCGAARFAEALLASAQS